MDERRVAYVLKGYPRLSETFIASEIWRLEQLGLSLRLYVCKPADEAAQHPVVDLIQAQPVYLPHTTSLSATTFPRWLRTNLTPFLPALGKTARRHPLRLFRAAAAATAQAVRARQGWRPRSVYAKELLLAVALADQLHDAGDVGHLHAHFAHGTTTVTWLASIVTGLPFSFTGHAKDIYRPSLNPAGLLARKMRAARFVLTCTTANAEHLRAVYPAAEVVLAYHGLNADFARLLADAPAYRPPAHLRVVSVGRLVPKKGFDVLITALARIRDVGVEAELIIAGESGDAGPRLASLIDTLGLRDRVRLVGTVSQAELLALYRSASVFALACRIDDNGDRDGIPNVLVEAMAAGLAVVSTSVSGIPEVVAHEENGLLVAPNDPDALADALLRLAKDPLLAAQLAAAATATIAAHWDGDQLARQLGTRFQASAR